MRLLVAAFALLAAPTVAQEVTSAPGALLRGLDKVTGEATDLTVAVGDTVKFGKLSVSLTDCRYPTADPTSNAYAQMIIFEEGQDTPVFDGWMIASSPALSAVDHPRYDVWVLRCSNTGSAVGTPARAKSACAETAVRKRS